LGTGNWRHLQNRLAAWATKSEKHMGLVDGELPLSGQVEIDETYVGGHRPGVRDAARLTRALCSECCKRDGQVMTKIVPDCKKKRCKPIIESQRDSRL